MEKAGGCCLAVLLATALPAREVFSQPGAAHDGVNGVVASIIPVPPLDGSEQEQLGHWSWLIEQGGVPVTAMARFYCERAAVYLRLNQLGEAMTDYQTAGTEAPHILQPYMGRAQIQIMRADYHAALSELRHAADLKAGSQDLIAGAQALCYIQLGRFDRAQEMIEKALRINPDDARFHVIRNMLNRQIDEEYKALFDLRQARELGPEWVEVYEQAMTQHEADTVPLVETPLGSEASLEQVAAAFAKRDYAGVTQSVDRLLRREPGNLQARLYRARALMQSGQKSAAVPDLNALLAALPNTPRLLLMRARAYYAGSEYQAAVRDYEKVLNTVPDDVQIREELQRVRKASGE
jgi:tetratricopeptide (TPR) repeat protein